MKLTRRQRAAQLLVRVERGPAFSDLGPLGAAGASEASRFYLLWSESWILADLKYLVPELRKPEPNRMSR